MRTAPSPASRRPRPRHRPVDAPWLRTLRGVSGALAAGLVVLTGLLAVAQWYSGSAPVPGPGAAMITGHALGAGAAVLAQLVADRSRGGRAAAAAAVVLVVVALVLWFGWWR